MAQEPISNIRKRIRDWLINSATGGNVDQLDLDLLNRANRYLEDQRRWDFLRRVYTMTVTDNGSGQGKTCILPPEVQVIEQVYIDNAIVGKPQIWFYEDDPDVAQRYTKEYVYDKAVGGYWVLTFPSVSPLLSNPKMLYKTTLPEFVGADADGNEIVEYAVWPSELLIRCAQKIHVEEKGTTGFDVQGILNAYADCFQKFETKMQFTNQRADLTPKNKFGMPYKVEGMRLNGSGSMGSHSPYVPSTFFHGY